MRKERTPRTVLRNVVSVCDPPDYNMISSNRDKSADVFCGKLSSKPSLPECLTARNISLTNGCESPVTTRGVDENINNHDKVIAMDLPAELPSLVELGRTAKPGRYSLPMRVEGNSLCVSQVQDLPKELATSSDSDETIDFEDHSDRRYASCNLVRTKAVGLLRAPKARSLNSTPFHELASGSGVNFPKCLSTQSVDSFGSSRSVAAGSSTCTDGALRKMREKRRVPPIQPIRKNMLLPLDRHENSKRMSIEGTQVVTKIREQDRENSFNANSPGNQERRETNKNSANQLLPSPCADGIENVVTNVTFSEERKSFTEPDSTFALPSITVSQPSDRYRSRFRVKLLPLVTKSDSLPNLVDSLNSQPSGLLVTSSLGHSAPALDLEGISEKAEQWEDTEVKEGDAEVDDARPKRPRGRARSLSVDSAFSGSSLIFGKEPKEIAIDGNKMLPEIKAEPMAKKLSLPSLKGTKKAEKMWFPPTNNTPRRWHEISRAKWLSRTRTQAKVCWTGL